MAISTTIKMITIHSSRLQNVSWKTWVRGAHHDKE